MGGRGSQGGAGSRHEVIGAPLAGHRIVVTRAGEQAAELTDRLVALGADVVDAPAIAIVDTDDDGAALRDALAASDRYDWVVVTSPNGARRVLDALGGRALRASVAVVGPGTAAAFAAAGVTPQLVPERFVAEGLLAAFPPPPAPAAGTGRVLVAQVRDARAVLVDGLRAAGWTVDAVEAYRTVAVAVDEATRTAVASADVITFASASAVRSFVAAHGVAAVPAMVVCIGPVTAAAAIALDIRPTRVAEPHSIEGLVAAVVAVVAAVDDGPRT